MAVAVVPADTLDFFDGVATLNRQRNEKIHAEAINLALILNRMDIVPVLLKGGANLLSGLYADSAHRMMTDLDVLVPAQRLLDCVAELRRIFAAVGKTVVLVTHDLREAALLGSTIALLRAGRVVQQGSLDDLARRPTEPFVTEFLSAQAPPPNLKAYF
jgi:ABC-type proline/glycine betaine transport system ATPase subunit